MLRILLVVLSLMIAGVACTKQGEQQQAPADQAAPAEQAPAATETPAAAETPAAQ